MPTCTKCGIEKGAAEFSLRIDIGLPRRQCKECRSAADKASHAKAYRADPERFKKQTLAWQKANHDKRLAAQRLYRYKFPEQHRAYVKKHREKFPEKCVAAVQKRRADKYRATPSCVNRFFVDEIYHLARVRSKATGFPWHVDHIVPLKHPKVCGLHWERNLQVIPATENRRKRNLHWPEMP